jgi:voltage-gated potassium channel
MAILFLPLRAIWAMRRDSGFVSLALLAAIAVVGGSVFYWQVEDLRLLDAVYLSVLTLTTVGYGDFAPTTDVGKVFTAVFVIAGVGILLALLAAIAAQVRRHSVSHGPLARLATRALGTGMDGVRDPTGEVQAVPALSGLGEYDLLVIGTDDISRQTALEAARSGLRVVLADGKHVLPENDGNPGGTGLFSDSP